MTSHRIYPILVLTLLALLTLAASQRLAAQVASTPIVVATPEGITADEVNVVARDLWCPLCNGVRLDACELKACAQMRDMIAIKLGDGESSQEIKDYFVDYYGPQVLGAPPMEGFNGLAWVLPAVVLGIAGVLTGLFLRRLTARRYRSDTESSLPEDDDAPREGDGEHISWLEEELKDYE